MALKQALVCVLVMAHACYSLTIASCSDDGTGACSAGESAAPQTTRDGAHQLMQKKSSTMIVQSGLKEVICDQSIGRDMPLTEEGFLKVEESCCYEDMKDFVRRTVLSIGLQVCDEGGLSGFSPFFTCQTNPTSFADLKSALGGETGASGNKCPWLAEAGDSCVSEDPSCGVSLTPAGGALFKGYMGLDAAQNPPALVRSPAVTAAIRAILSKALNIPEEAIIVVVGTGPIGQVSFLQLLSCSVFVSYAIVQTNPPSLDPDMVAAAIASIDPVAMQQTIAATIAEVVPEVGSLEITTFR